jgi:ATPase subunit of ABC transporter with duplicated ATPase domains
MLHQLLLDLPTNKKLSEILSEGEQRSIAIGAFLAELSLANHNCGIIFDDPVSSLDHWKRKDVARRLVNEGTRRQVIIFTHDTTFLGQLCDEIEETAVPNSMLFLEWHGGHPGHVNDGLPWDHQGYKARIDALEKVQRKLAKSWTAYPGEDDAAAMRQQYDRLRATLERVIQDVVFNGVVKRTEIGFMSIAWRKWSGSSAQSLMQSTSCMVDAARWLMPTTRLPTKRNQSLLRKTSATISRRLAIWWR